MTEKQRPNRMIKAEVEREEETTKEDIEVEEIVKERCYPCKYCGSETTVIKSWPALETTQHPVKIVKFRNRRCLTCNRQFKTQELVMRDHPDVSVQV